MSDFASGYLYFGLHRTVTAGFSARAPNATQIFLIGTFNDWKEEKKYSLKRKANGNWEIKLPADAMKHGDLYKLMVSLGRRLRRTYPGMDQSGCPR